MEACQLNDTNVHFKYFKESPKCFTFLLVLKVKILKVTIGGGMKLEQNMDWISVVLFVLVNNNNNKKLIRVKIK